MNVTVTWHVSEEDTEENNRTKEEIIESLPAVLEVPDHLTDDEVAEWLSDQVGWLVEGWSRVGQTDSESTGSVPTIITVRWLGTSCPACEKKEPTNAGGGNEMLEVVLNGTVVYICPHCLYFEEPHQGGN